MSEDSDPREIRGLINILLAGFVATSLALVVAVGFGVAGFYDESSWAPSACQDKFGENATWINDTDRASECRLENGSVRNVTLEIWADGHV